MAQGKPFTAKQKATIIESLRPYLEMGYSRNKACRFIGLHETTLSKWVQADEALSMKLVAWENHMTGLALANVYKAIEIEKKTKTGRVDNSWRYLERREESFKPKADMTTDNKPLPQPLLYNVLANDIAKKDSGSTEED